MKVLTRRPAGIVWATLAALLLTAVASFHHAHDPLGPAQSTAELAVFSSGHDCAEPAVHVEAATAVETSTCVACILRPRKDAGLQLVLRFDPTLRVGSPAVLGAQGRLAGSASRVPASRAPPRA